MWQGEVTSNERGLSYLRSDYCLGDQRIDQIFVRLGTLGTL